VSCHDNHTLYDKLKVSRPDASETDLVKMHKLSNTIVLTSQGIPFLHAGVEMKRTKGGEHNSYNKPDSVNLINWDWKYQNKELVTYYKELISLRKAHPAFRMPTNEMVQKNLLFLPTNDRQLIAYQLKDHANNDSWKNIIVIFNGSDVVKKVDLPAGKWKAALSNYQFNNDAGLYAESVNAAPYSAMILYQN
jgi:pullulanase